MQSVKKIGWICGAIVALAASACGDSNDGSEGSYNGPSEAFGNDGRLTCVSGGVERAPVNGTCDFKVQCPDLPVIGDLIGDLAIPARVTLEHLSGSVREGESIQVRVSGDVEVQSTDAALDLAIDYAHPGSNDNGATFGATIANSPINFGAVTGGSGALQTKISAQHVAVPKSVDDPLVLAFEPATGPLKLTTSKVNLSMTGNTISIDSLDVIDNGTVNDVIAELREYFLSSAADALEDAIALLEGEKSVKVTCELPAGDGYIIRTN